jgi:hypothetical protein
VKITEFGLDVLRINNGHSQTLKMNISLSTKKLESESLTTPTLSNIPLILRHVILNRISGYTALERFKHNSFIINEKMRW